jgi:hypothetical protein
MCALTGLRCKKEGVHHEIKQCAFGNKDGSVCNYVIQVDSEVKENAIRTRLISHTEAVYSRATV